MKFILVGIAALLFVVLSGAYYYFAWPPMVLRHKTEHALVTFNRAVATHDRAKISEALKTLLAPQAHIKLEISFFSPLKQNVPATVQDFDKEQFLAFVDNVLYSLKTYSFDATLHGFTLSADRKMADVVFNSQNTAEDLLFYAGMGANMHFNADIVCTGRADFGDAEPVLDNAECTVQLTMSAQQGQAE